MFEHQRSFRLIPGHFDKVEVVAVVVVPLLRDHFQEESFQLFDTVEKSQLCNYLRTGLKAKALADLEHGSILSVHPERSMRLDSPGARSNLNRSRRVTI